jgi:outer membrane immunogenic protein
VAFGLVNLSSRRRPRACCALAVACLAVGCAESALAQPVPQPPVYNWTGFYAGLNGGFGGGRVTPANPVAAVDPFYGYTSTDNQSHRLSGAFAGGQAGYNYQFQNQFVLGVESDLQWSNIGASSRIDTMYVYNTGSPVPSSGLDTASMNIRQNWFGTTRLRLGYQFADRFLAYVTGGIAYSEFAVGNTGTGTELSPTPHIYSLTSGTATSTRIGWAAGAGLEHALGNNLSIKTEYLYSEYSGIAAPYRNVSESTPPVISGTFSSGTLGIHLVRAGLNYKFGGSGDTLGAGGFAVKAPAAPTFAWTGFYAGVNGGYGGGIANPARSEQEIDQIFGFGTNQTETDTKNINEQLRFGGALAGAQFGYNRQLANRFVVGAETDLQWSDIRASRQSNSGGAYTDPGMGAFTGSSGLAIGQHWFGTTRLRLGYQVFDRFLAYVTGGVAYTGISASISGATADNSFGPYTSTTSGSGSSTKVGWALGGGFEVPIIDNLSLKTEYLYTEYSGMTVAYQTLAISPFFFTDTTRGSLSTGTIGLHIARAGLNWKL